MLQVNGGSNLCNNLCYIVYISPHSVYIGVNSHKIPQISELKKGGAQCEPECALGFEKKVTSTKKAKCECEGNSCKFVEDFKCIPACDRNILDETPVGLVPKCKFPISGEFFHNPLGYNLNF